MGLLDTWCPFVKGCDMFLYILYMFPKGLKEIIIGEGKDPWGWPRGLISSYNAKTSNI